MAVVGIDFGSLHSKIGVARHRGIDIITNEVSNRATPSLIGFGPKSRAIGEPAKTQETSNFKNTVGAFKRLIGLSLDDPDVQQVEKKFINAQLIDVDGNVGVQVNYAGDRTTLSSTQLTAAYLGKLRDIASTELKVPVSDVVIAVPGWFTDIQRRALLDAASIANLKVLRLINDSTAVALGYGITKSDLPDAEKSENPRNIVFVDVGHSDLTVSVVSFVKGALMVKATAYDRHLGGRDIDHALVNHFAAEFKTKYKVDALSSPKAVFRLTAGCEKLKKILSANAEAPLNVESLMNDVDASSKLTREELEELIAPVLDRIPAPLQRALADSGIPLEEIDAIELVGGSTRIPAVRAKISTVFPGKPLSTTLNQDEAIGRGATFACAMLSPVFRVRDFTISDIAPYSIKVQWNPADAPPEDQDESELTVFPRGNSIPSTKVLTFARKGPFELEARYGDVVGEGAVESTGQGKGGFLSQLQVTGLPALSEAATVKVKTRLNLHGIVSFEGVYTEEIEEVAAEAMEVDAVEGEEAKPKKRTTKRKKDVQFVTRTTSLGAEVVERYRERESEMYSADKLVADTEDCKNALEEYVYDMRSKLDDRYASFSTSSEKSSLLSKLSAAEDWLYSEDGEDATKSAYVARLDECRAIGDPISFRYKDTEDRKVSGAALRSSINEHMARASAIQEDREKFSHITPQEVEGAIEKIALCQKWFEDQNIRQGEKAKNVDPVLTSREIEKRREELGYAVLPVFNKIKPKSSVPPSGTGTPNPEPEVKKEEQAEGKEKRDPKEPSEMDID
ncbi:heat shock protein 70 [Pterulicium gracile]|uniref:Heat shock protein 70 n=1 Tax=Pterulicium gracile TaxID=1884261 RepID=A0A5C3Q377_9AGAR|nr:heat shock protein 70 [Pterula gracilis]